MKFTFILNAVTASDKNIQIHIINCQHSDKLNWQRVESEPFSDMDSYVLFNSKKDKEHHNRNEENTLSLIHYDTKAVI